MGIGATVGAAYKSALFGTEGVFTRGLTVLRVEVFNEGIAFSVIIALNASAVPRFELALVNRITS